MASYEALRAIRNTQKKKKEEEEKKRENYRRRAGGEIESRIEVKWRRMKELYEREGRAKRGAFPCLPSNRRALLASAV